MSRTTLSVSLRRRSPPKVGHVSRAGLVTCARLCWGGGVTARHVGIGTLGESLVGLRVISEDLVRPMRQSLARHGQLTALGVYAAPDGHLEVIDGFKRLRGARELAWSELKVQVVADDVVQAKAAVLVLNHAHALSELEEAWLIRSLYREDGMTQPQIARLLGRHKSWVCRRLVLAEALEDTVQADVRLGLLGARAACALGRLPRSNQRAAADAVVRRGLTASQTERLVFALLACPDDAGRAVLLAEDSAWPATPTSSKGDGPRTPAEWIIADVAAVTRLSARLHARLLGHPLASLGATAAALVEDALAALAPTLRALARRIATVTHEETHDTLDHPRGAHPPDGPPREPGDAPPGDRPGAQGQPQHGAEDPRGP